MGRAGEEWDECAVENCCRWGGAVGGGEKHGEVYEAVPGA